MNAWDPLLIELEATREFPKVGLWYCLSSPESGFYVPNDNKFQARTDATLGGKYRSVILNEAAA